MRLLNNPTEIALRLSFVLKNSNGSLDLQRIIYYNYLLIHSSDIENGPRSLHPQIPNRSCKILVSREVIKAALNILISKELVKIKFNKTGVFYQGDKKQLTCFLKNFDSEYTRDLERTSIWINENFTKMTDLKLNEFIMQNLGKWGGEFIIEND